MSASRVTQHVALLGTAVGGERGLRGEGSDRVGLTLLEWLKVALGCRFALDVFTIIQQEDP